LGWEKKIQSEVKPPTVVGMFQQQAAMMGYVDVFFLLAIMFAACPPLILIMKKAPQGGGWPGRWRTRGFWLGVPAACPE